jgi:hypothetical protein
MSETSRWSKALARHRRAGVLRDWSGQKGKETMNMNTSGHTPGPWIIEPYQGLFSYRIIGPRGGMLALCGTANAALIAAAPDLLAAMKEVLQCDKQSPKPRGDGCRRCGQGGAMDNGREYYRTIREVSPRRS